MQRYTISPQLFFGASDLEQSQSERGRIGLSADMHTEFGQRLERLLRRSVNGNEKAKAQKHKTQHQQRINVKCGTDN